jgi:hypothetical protein
MLTAKKIERLRQQPGRYLDGGDSGVEGLYLQVTKGGASWLLRYESGGHDSKHGRERWMGLGLSSSMAFTITDDHARQRPFTSGLPRCSALVLGPELGSDFDHRAVSNRFV